MCAVQTDKGAAQGKWGLIAASILVAALVVASIWSLSRVLNKSSPHGSVVPANEVATMDAVLSQEAIERQDMAEQRAAPVIQTTVTAPPAVISNKQNADEVKLQKAKAKVNQLIVERMKQYVRDNPNRDNRELEEQIKRREKQGPQ